MKAEIRAIEPHDFHYSWQEFQEATAARALPVLNDYGIFSLLIGTQGSEAADMFEALVSTPSAAARARRGRIFTGFIVENFEPELIRKTLTAFVDSVESDTWMGLVDKLQSKLQWEYEGMDPVR